jgi:hypothetical protein
MLVVTAAFTTRSVRLFKSFWTKAKSAHCSDVFDTEAALQKSHNHLELSALATVGHSRCWCIRVCLEYLGGGVVVAWWREVVGRHDRCQERAKREGARVAEAGWL